jgi:H+-transporting ATPase
VQTGDEFASVTLLQALTELESSAQGLTSAQARSRLQRYGPNEIAEQRRNPVLVFLGYFWAPIPWMIEAALVLSLVARHWTDAVIIAVLLVMNGVVAFAEEHQAANAIAALKQRLATSARVLRDGAWVMVEVRELVPGDVVRVRLGDVVPADVRVLDGVTLEVDQSALTGESLAVSRGQGEVLYSGSVLVRGEADALVYATGASSYFGRTTALVQTAGAVSHFQRAVLRIGNYLIVMAAALVALTVIVSLIRGNPVLQTLEFALVVTIASVPVALPAVLSVTMAVGARKLAHQQAVVSHLPAVEELGGMDLLCSDKTGTLTQNRLAVATHWTAPGISDHDLLAAAAWASRAEDNDPIDLAVLAAAGEEAQLRVERFTPFDPVSKRTEAVVRGADGRLFRVSKGAPQIIAALCDRDSAAGQVGGVVDRFGPARMIGGVDQQKQRPVVSEGKPSHHAPGFGAGNIEQLIARPVALSVKRRDPIAQVGFEVGVGSEHKTTHRRVDAAGADHQVEPAGLTMLQRDVDAVVILRDVGDAVVEDGFHVAVDGAVDQRRQIAARHAGEPAVEVAPERLDREATHFAAAPIDQPQFLNCHNGIRVWAAVWQSRSAACG